MNDIHEVKAVIDRLGGVWAQHNDTMTQHDAEIRKLGRATTETEAKLTHLGDEMDDLHRVKAELEQVTTAMRRPARPYEAATPPTPFTGEHKAAFNRFLRKGDDHGLADLERKALTVYSDPDGGYLVPADMNGKIVSRVFDTSPIRQIAAMVAISTDALEGLRDTDEAAAGWVAESAGRPETATPQLGAWRIPVQEMYANPRATQKLLDDAALDVETWIAGKIADKFSRLENTAFVVGTGVGQPRGFTTYPTAQTSDASRPWGTFEHIKTGVNGDFAGSNPADVLFDLIQAFKQPYLAGAMWVTRRAVIAKIRKFKESTTNAYLWQPGLQQGQPATLLGYPVVLAEDMPALATDALSLAFGNFREGYQIVDRQGIRLLRDPYSAKPQVQFYATRRVGGDAVQFEAIKFVKFSA